MGKSESLLFGFLFLKGGPVKKTTLMSLFNANESEFAQILTQMRSDLHDIPLTLIESDTEIELTLDEELTVLFDPYIKREKEGDLTQSTLETLAAIAYTEKPTKFLVSYVRGVSATQSISSLIAKDLIEEDKEGVYHLTPAALSHLGITKKEDLPSYNRIKEELKQKLENHEEKY